MVISWILNVVSKEMANSLLYLDIARSVWTDLEDRFCQGIAPSIFQLKQQLNSLSQVSLDLNTYFTKLKILWDELRNHQPILICECEGKKPWMNHQQVEYVTQFLMGLNESYADVRAQILMIDPLPSMSKIFNSLCRKRDNTQLDMQEIN